MGSMKYAVEMGLGAMTYVSSFIKIGWGIQKLTQTHNREEEDSISLLYDSKLKIKKGELGMKYAFHISL
jgi:hypothetical protein